MQGEVPASLAIGTHVSAKYKGAFCEAKVHSVAKQVKVRLTFKNGLGGATVSDEYVRSSSPLQIGATVSARHPDKQEYLEATVNKIQDQSQYTVVFDDGDITTLRRNALCMKSGKHFNASESLDNLPLTHPEHFSTPVGGGGGGSGKRRRKGDGNNESGDEYDSSSDDNNVISSYVSNIGRVVCVEVTESKKGKGGTAKETWFPALIVAPSASNAVKIDTKEEFLIRSFKDGRYYTISKKDTTKFHREAIKKTENAHLKDAMEKAINYIDKEELPSHWEKNNLFLFGEESTTESSETESLPDDDEENEESPEEKDHLVAELYKHMEDRGQPINKTPSIEKQDVDLYKLYRIVDKLGGHARVTNNNLWRTVSGKLGFNTTWSVNQVRLTYKRYLQSFEELNRTLGCTMKMTTPRSRRQSGQPQSAGSSGSSRSVIRGSKQRSAKVSDSPSGAAMVLDMESDKSSISSQEEIVTTSAASTLTSGPLSSSAATTEDNEVQKPKQQDNEETTNVGKRTCVGSKAKKEDTAVTARKSEAKMTTRPRRDSTSSLAAAMQNKERKDNIGGDELLTGRRSKAAAATPKEELQQPQQQPLSEESRRAVVRVDRDRETESEARKLQAKAPRSSSREDSKREASVDNKKETKENDSVSPPIEKKDGPGRKKVLKKRAGDKVSRSPPQTTAGEEEVQHLPEHIEVALGDKIKVFYKSNTIYEAKVIKVKEIAGERWPKYLVHYQGWNARYDEVIRRSKIAENMSWTKEREKNSAGKQSNVSHISIPLPENVPESRSRDIKREEKTLRGGKTKPVALNSKDKPGTPSRSRTGSPAQLKRQNSRTKKESEESESEDDLRKSARLHRSGQQQQQQQPTATANSNAATIPLPANSPSDGGSSRRSNRKRHLKDESETDDVDVEKEDAGANDLLNTPSKPKRGRKGVKAEEEGEEIGTPTRSSRNASARESRALNRQHQSTTPKGKDRKGSKIKSEDEEDDPYAFKEPEPLEENRLETVNASSATVPRSGKTLTPVVVKKKEEDSGIEDDSKRKAVKSKRGETEADSGSDETGKRTMRRPTRASNKAGMSSSGDTSESKESEEEDKPNKSIMNEAESEEEKSEKLHVSKKQRELFPFLSAKISNSSAASSNQLKVITSGDSGSASDSSPTKATDSDRDGALSPVFTTSHSRSVTTTASSTTAQHGSRTTETSKLDMKAVTATKSSASQQSLQQPKSAKKTRKTPRKPNSSEIVDSESDGEESAPVTAIKSSAAQSKDEIGEEAKTERSKGTKEEDMDLACGETIPGSPTHPSSGAGSTDNSPMTSPIVSKSTLHHQTHKQPTSTSNKLEMPFASVPESVPGGVGEAVAGKDVPSTLPPRKTYPGASENQQDMDENEMVIAESSSASQSPLRGEENRQDDSKSPVDSSDVDMDSLSGRNKVGSEDSRLEVEEGRASGYFPGLKRKPSSNYSNSPAKSRKRRAREVTASSASRGNKGSSRGRGSIKYGNKEEETEESAEDGGSSNKDHSEITNMSKEELDQYAESLRKTTKNCFLVNLTEFASPNDRIAALQEAITRIRKTYTSTRSDQAVHERRYKKVKRKEREKASSSSGSSNNGDNAATSVSTTATTSNSNGPSSAAAVSTTTVEAAA